MLLDTHVLIWFLTNDPQLPQTITQQISGQPLVYVSAATIWEIAIKGSLGKLELAGKPIDSADAVQKIITECTAQQFEFLDISAAHAAHAPFLKGNHKDPFDRMLAAQAAQQGILLVSGDAAFDRLSPGVQRLWAGTPVTASPRKRRPAKSVKKIGPVR